MQKLGQAVVFLVVFVGVAALLYKIAAPHVLPPVTSNSSDSVSPPAVSNPVTPPSPSAAVASVAPTAPPSGRIAAPRSAAQRESDDIEARRAPYYQWLRTNYGDVLAAEQPNSSDTATLDLYTRRADPSLTLWLVAHAVQPYADQYGFNHVRFFAPNPPTEVERYRFAAEASPDRDGQWHAFEK